SPRNDARAEAYQKRWLERDAWERTRQHQIDTLEPKDVLLDAALDADTRAQVLQLIARHEKAIQHAWIARRTIAADPDAQCYVIGVQASAWTRLRRKDKAL